MLRAQVDGAVVDAADPPALAAQKAPNIEAVVDRVVIREGIRDRIAESVNLAVDRGDGLVAATHEQKTPAGPVWHDRLFSTQYACPHLPDQLRGDRAADVQLQQPLRGLPEVRRAGRHRLRPRAGPARRRHVAGRRGDRTLAQTIRRPCKRSGRRS